MQLTEIDSLHILSIVHMMKLYLTLKYAHISSSTTLHTLYIHPYTVHIYTTAVFEFLSVLDAEQ